MHALRLGLAASAVLLTSLAGATELDKTSLSDAGLRGHVRQCIEQAIHPADGTLSEQSLTTTSVYSPEGRLLETRIQDGSGADYLVTYTYDSAGRLVNKSSSRGLSDADRTSTSYTYDDKGHLLAVKSRPGDAGAVYEYDNHDGKRRIEHLPVFTPQPQAAVGAISWENSDVYLLPSSGGTLTTLYDEHDRPAEGRVSDADGRMTMRIVRTYDAEGRVLGDKLIPEDMESVLPAQLTGQLNDAQKKAFARLRASFFASGESGYTYDPHGRVIEKH